MLKEYRWDRIGICWLIFVLGISLRVDVLSGQAQVPSEKIEADQEAIKKSMLEMMRRRAIASGLAGMGIDEDSKNAISGVSIARGNGALEKIKDSLAPYLKISEEPDKTQLSLPTDMQSGHALRNAIGRTLRNYGGSSYSSGSGFRCSISCRELIGNVSRSNQVTSLTLKETTDQKRVLYASQSDGKCRITLSSPAGYYLALNFSADNQVHVVECDRDFLFNKTYSSIGKLQLAETEFYQKRLGPVLERFGIDGPANVFSPLSQSLARDLLKHTTESQKQFVQQHLALVSSDDYQARQGALERLAKEFATQRIPIVAAILSEKQPAEFRHQLLGVVEKKDSKLHKVVNNGFLTQKLLSDLSFLTWLLKEEEQGEKNLVVIERLRERLAKMTDLPEDSDVNDWIKLVLNSDADQPLGDIRDLSEFPMLDVKAEDVGVGLSELVCLKVVDGRLAIDRQQWVQPFGKQSLKSHYDNLKKQLDESGFPQSWLKIPSTYTLDQDSYPLILFEKIVITESIDPRARNLMPYRPASNQQATTNLLRMNHGRHDLSVDMGSSKVKLNSSVFDFDWTTIDGKELSILDEPATTFCMVVQLTEEQQRMMIRSVEGKFIIQCLDGEKVFAATTESYEEFCQQYPKVVEKLRSELAETVRISLPDHQAELK